MVVIHSIFKECQKYTLDSFWKDLLERCSLNKFPRGARYDGHSNTLIIQSSIKGRKPDIIDIPTDPEDAYYIIINIFKKRLGLYSSLDLQIRDDEIKENESENIIDLDCEWKKLKPNFVRAEIMNKYVEKLTKRHNLNLSQSKKLYRLIEIGFQLKTLEHEDVVYENREIQNIKGLEFHDNKFIIKNKARFVSKTEKTIPSKKFNQSVERYMKEYRKIIDDQPTS